MTLKKILLACVSVGVIGLSGCSGAEDSSISSPSVESSKTEGAAQLVEAPLPEGYAELIEASKTEKDLLIYSNVAEYNWEYILEEFTAKYPWTKGKVHTLDMGPSKVFERYLAESSVDHRTADFIVSGAPNAWIRFQEKGGISPYESPHQDEVPEWSKPFPGLYTISTDPMIIVHNKILLDESERPTSMGDFRKWSQEGKFKDKVVTYNAASHSFALAIHWYFDRFLKGESEQATTELGAITRLENGGAVMSDKIAAGEFVAGYFISGITVFPFMNQKGRDKVIGWSLIEDGTPVFVRGMAVTQEATSPALAKLMLNFILSREGQIAVGKGGMTPYRSDVKKGDVPYLTYADIVDEVGEDNVFRVLYDKELLAETDAFIEGWKSKYRLKE